MSFKVIENSPVHKHTISEEETTFLASVEGKDYYYRDNSMDHNIDIRYSEKPSDYVSWTMQSILKQYEEYENFDNVVPRFIFNKAKKYIK